MGNTQPTQDGADDYNVQQSEWQLNDLPREVVCLIFAYVGPKQLLCSVMRLNRYFKGLANDEMLWKEFCLSIEAVCKYHSHSYLKVLFSNAASKKTFNNRGTRVMESALEAFNPKLYTPFRLVITALPPHSCSC